MLRDHFFSTVVSTLRRFYKHGVPSHILYFGDSLGDNLLLTTLAKALRDRGARNIWIKSDRRDLFAGNPDISLVMPFQGLLSTALLRLFNVKVIHPVYTSYHPELDGDVIPEKHIILKMADCIPIRGEISNKPVLKLTAQEVAAGRSRLRPIVIVTSTSGATVPMDNKEWLNERYQELVDQLATAYSFVQLGTAGDAPLRGVQDLRGKTTVRESAAILQNALLLITHVGFMMHLARAVDCKAVVIYGGREKPWQSGYGCFKNIYSDLSCSPCWLHNRCGFGRECMQMISTRMVADAVLEELKRPGGPEIDKLYND